MRQKPVGERGVQTALPRESSLYNRVLYKSALPSRPCLQVKAILQVGLACPHFLLRYSSKPFSHPRGPGQFLFQTSRQRVSYPMGSPERQAYPIPGFAALRPSLGRRLLYPRPVH